MAAAAGITPRTIGRSVYGSDPIAYHEARPPYPAALFETLFALAPVAGASIFEIGSGTGLATARFLAERPARFVAIEPDPRLCAYLARTHAAERPPLEIVNRCWEAARITPGAFDIGLAATSFDWLPQEEALAQVHAALRPGGLWAMWWNIYGLDDGPDPLRDAAAPGFGEHENGAVSVLPERPMMLDGKARLADLARAGFVETGSALLRWPIRLTAAKARALAATFSSMAVASEAARNRVLDGLEQFIESQSGGAVERDFATALYWGRKPLA